MGVNKELNLWVTDNCSMMVKVH